MGSFFGKPGGASAWHADFPARPATVQVETSPPLEPLEPAGVSLVVLDHAMWHERAIVMARVTCSLAR